MSVGGALPFWRSPVLDHRRLPILLLLTLAGSALGALLVVVVAPAALPLVVGIAMLVVTAFSLAHRTAGLHPAPAPSRTARSLGYAATFLLGVYGGFFSGGYVTLLTAAYILLFGMTFLEAVAVTKVINVCSSAVATVIFMSRGIVDYRLGVVLGLTMFVGALLGARWTVRLDNRWIRRIFVGTVVLLAVKTLLYDVIWINLLA